MTIVKNTYDYEILMRLSEDGLQGAHFVSITEVKDDETGEIFSTKTNDPVSLAIRDGDSGRPLEDILGTVVTNVLVTNGEQAAEILRQEEEISDLLLQLTMVQDQLATAQAELELRPPFPSVEV